MESCQHDLIGWALRAPSLIPPIAMYSYIEEFGVLNKGAGRGVNGNF